MCLFLLFLGLTPLLLLGSDPTPPSLQLTQQLLFAGARVGERDREGRTIRELLEREREAEVERVRERERHRAKSSGKRKERERERESLSSPQLSLIDRMIETLDLFGGEREGEAEGEAEGEREREGEGEGEKKKSSSSDTS